MKNRRNTESKARAICLEAATVADDVIKRLQWMSGDRRLFPRVDKGDRLDRLNPRMLGIQRLASAGAPNLLVLRDKWPLLVRSRHLGPKVLRIFERRGLLRPGKEPGRHVVQRQ